MIVPGKACSWFICFESEPKDEEDPEKVNNFDDALLSYLFICLAIALLTKLHCESALLGLGFLLVRE